MVTGPTGDPSWPIHRPFTNARLTSFIVSALPRVPPSDIAETFATVSRCPLARHVRVRAAVVVEATRRARRGPLTSLSAVEGEAGRLGN